MSIAVVVEKNGKSCIGADTQSNWGSLIQSEHYREKPSKIQKISEAYIALAGSGAHNMVWRHFFREHSEKIDLSSSESIFSTWLTLHNHLKDDYFLNPRAEKDDSYETSRMVALIANKSGIFVVGTTRSVDKLKRFWAIGSGQEYALGAMHAKYETTDDVQVIAEAGLQAAIEFDDGCGAPHEIILL